MKHILILVMLLALGPIVHPAPGHAAPEDEFRSWRSAYEDLETTTAVDPDPSTLLDNAGYLVRADRTGEALSLLRSSGPFHMHPTLEVQRLLLLGRLSRQTGDFTQALASFAAAHRLLDDATSKELLGSEPGLNTFFQIAWLSIFWSDQNRAGSGERDGILLRSLSAAASIWGDDPFWTVLEQSVFGHGVPEAARFEPLLIMEQDQVRALVVQALGMWSLKRFDRGMELLESIAQPEVRRFWKDFGMFLQNGRAPEAHEELRAFPKIMAFWAAGGIERIPRESWFVPEQEGRVRAERREAGDPAETLGLALALAAGDPGSRLSPAAGPAALPLCLELALTIRDQEPIERSSLGQGILRFLASAAGVELGRPEPAAWLRVEPDMVARAAALHPLDRKLTFLFWSGKLEAGFDAEAALRVAFLFPGTEAGTRALLSLTKAALAAGNEALAWGYLERVDQQATRGELEVDYLGTRGWLQLTTGREREALETYVTLLERHPGHLSPRTLLDLARTAQRQGDHPSAAPLLEELLERKPELEPGLQSEILFLAAGWAEQQGRTAEALDSFMRLAWASPEQPEGLAALFRSALLYERKGMLETARRLLEEVIGRSSDQHLQAIAKERLHELALRKGRDVEHAVKAAGYLF
jgi:tetratricopeptide (TPR) repeat protein